jgi:predicted nucleic acid-binding protein
VILPDSSAWVDYLRDRESVTVDALDAAIRQGIAVVCEPVWAELLRGARDDRNQARLERTLAGFPMIPTLREDWETAATIGRMTRRNGLTVRSFLDCLIAGIAIRSDATVLHSDGGFERIAEVLPMLEQTRG